MSQALVPIERRTPTVADIENVMALARVLYTGGMQNKVMNKPEAVAARIFAGREVGLSDIQSVNWITIINGRAVIWGDAAAALVRVSGKLEGDITERIEGEGDDRVAVCVTKRKGATEPRETKFSVADAKKAQLWTKEGPWTDYPERQLMWRARGWNLRDNFNDVLCGLGIAEEEMDVPVRVVGTKVNLPDAPPAIAENQAEPPKEVADDATIQRIAAARPSWLRANGIDPEDETKVAEAWADLLSAYQVTSAKQLTPLQAHWLLDTLRKIGHAQEAKELFEKAGSAS